MLDDETTSHIVLEESAKITNKIMCCSAATAVEKGEVGGGVVCFADQLLLRSPFSSHFGIHQAGNFGIFGPDNALGSQ